MSDKFVVVSWFVAFEEGWAAKDAEVGETGFSTIAELVGGDRVSMRVCDVFGRARIDDVNGVCVSMMKEGAAEAGGVQKSVGRVVNFFPFSFAYTVHFLVLGCSCFNFNAKVDASGDELGRCEC